MFLHGKTRIYMVFHENSHKCVYFMYTFIVLWCQYTIFLALNEIPCNIHVWTGNSERKVYFIIKLFLAGVKVPDAGCNMPRYL